MVYHTATWTYLFSCDKTEIICDYSPEDDRTNWSCATEWNSYRSVSSSCRRQQLIKPWVTLQWRHDGHDGVLNHQPHQCLLNRLFRRRSKKTSKLCVTGLCAVTGEFPAQRVSNAENVSIWWRHHDHRHSKSLLLLYVPSRVPICFLWLSPKAPKLTKSKIWNVPAKF